MINICPISKILVDENVVRLNGFFTILLLLGSIWCFAFLVFLLIDLGIRSINIKYSPLAFISRFVVHDIFKKKPVPIGFAPKKFAVRIGFLIAFVLVALYLLNYFNSFYILLVMFILAVSGETFLRFCIGCKIYSFIQIIKNKLK